MVGGCLGGSKGLSQGSLQWLSRRIRWGLPTPVLQSRAPSITRPLGRQETELWMSSLPPCPELSLLSRMPWSGTSLWAAEVTQGTSDLFVYSQPWQNLQVQSLIIIKKKVLINNIHFKLFDLSLVFKLTTFGHSFSDFKEKQTSLCRSSTCS